MEKTINAQENGSMQYQKNVLPTSKKTQPIIPAQSRQKIKILIVEENFLTRFAIEQMLTGLGYFADFASDGKTALAFYQSSYALILKATQTSGADPAITSHYDEPEYQEKCLKAGMNGCANKPDSAQLKQWISEYVSDETNSLSPKFLGL